MRQSAGWGRLVTGSNILVVEDEKPIREMVAFGLRRGGYEVTEAADCREAFERLSESLPDLILVDWMLPDSSGLELTRSLKRSTEYCDVPVIMLTARATEDDKVAGLRSGADDYITKPFSQRELQARIAAVLRRATPEGGEDVLECGRLRLDTAGHRAHAGAAEVTLGPTEFRLLKFFMTHPDRVHSRTQLLNRVWGRNVYVEERTIDVHIRRLRKALSDSHCDAYIQTVRGAGYRFSVDA